MKTYSISPTGEHVEITNTPAPVGVKEIKYHKVICELCDREIGETYEDVNYAVCLDCYNKKK